eukprot:TRINITY_DN658_c0_g1_i5.p1 TRINITY_DN658_c0_g1~~TRINITY_DN658_c0_g1_i5.p1  ORF type:complete len:912 (-),score=280.66 TRINITY_DN658_c0_g1_i5:62-2797(-)
MDLDLVWETSKETYEQLGEVIRARNKHISTLTKLLSDVRTAHENFSKNLQTIAENFHREISTDSDEYDLLVSYYQFMSNYILKMANFHMAFARSAKNDTIEPFAVFTQNYEITNENIKNKGKEVLDGILSQKRKVQDCRLNYYKLSKSAEKSEEMIERSIKMKELGQATADDIQKATDKTVKLKIMAQEACAEYKNQLMTLNSKWVGFDRDYFDIYDLFNNNDEMRIHFTKQTIAQTVRQIHSLYSQDITCGGQNHEEKIREIDEKMKAIPDVVKFLKKSKEMEDLKQVKQEDFISYDIFKKNHQAFITKKLESSEEDLTSSQQEEDDNDQKFMENLIDTIVVGRDIKELKVPVPRRLSVERKDLPITRSTDSTDSSGDNSALCEKLTLEKSPSTEELFEGHIVHLISAQEWRRRFVINLNARIGNIAKIQIDEKNFKELSYVLRKIVSMVYSPDEPEEDVEFFYNLVRICDRFYHLEGNDKDKHVYLYQEIGSHKYWETPGSWENLLVYLINRNVDEEERLKKNRPEIRQDWSVTPKNKTIFGQLKMLGKKVTEMFDKKYLLAEYEIKRVHHKTLIAMNKYISNLCHDPTQAANIVVELAKRTLCDAHDIFKLLEIYDTKKTNELRKQWVLSEDNPKRSLIKREKAAKRWGEMLPIRLALEFLGPKDNLVAVLQVSKKWKDRLGRPIYKLLLNNYDKQLNEKQHTQLWLSVLKKDLVANPLDYPILKEESNHSEEIKAVEEVIILDVQRSLYIHKNINSMILQGLLRTFAHYDRDISYCQGMNYIMGYMFIMFLDEEVAFNVFCVCMKKHIGHLFLNEFAHLKLIFYQLERLIDLFMPDLAAHIKRETLDASYFATPWILTVFTSCFQYTTKSDLLMRVWDAFLLDGMRAILKTVLVILRHYKELSLIHI